MFNGSSYMPNTHLVNGNMLTGDGATYTYDARDRQSGVVKGTASASYTYYPTGLRKTKLAGGANTNFVWDGDNMVLEYTNSAASGKVYVFRQIPCINRFSTRKFASAPPQQNTTTRAENDAINGNFLCVRQ